MKRNYEVIIIGGGIIGCSVAFELAKRGIKDILLVERKYVTSGNTGRCGSGIRLQWGTELNSKLALDSMDIFENLQEYTGYDHTVGLNQCGYLLLATNESEWKMLQSCLDVQHKMGVKSFKVDLKKEVQEIVPGINTDGLIGATFCQRDGNADPFHSTFAYMNAAKRLGVEFLTYTEVKELVAKNGKIRGVRTTKGDFEAAIVLNCANVWAPGLAEQIGDKIPLFAERHEALITEPVSPMGAEDRMMPMVMSWQWRFFIQQTSHGSFIGGAIDANPITSEKLTPTFIEESGHIITKTLPMLRSLKVLRQWSGYFDNSPDHTPIIDFSKNAQGLINLCGFSGHGFMIAPRVAVMVARYLCKEEDNIDIMNFRLERFDTGDLFVEPTVHSMDS